MKRFALLIPLLILAASAASATTMVLGTDEELFDQAAAIVEGTVLAVDPSAAGRPATEYRFRVERTLKGRPTAGDLIVRVPGGIGADGWQLTIWGAPELQVGERALLFLGQYGDGVYGPLHLAMGAFHEVRDGDRKLALRDLSEMEDISGGEPAAARDRARDYQRFANWLADRAAGLRRPADYHVDGPVSALRPLHEKFNYLGGIKQRWTEFAAGASVGWRSHVSGQPGLASGGVPEFQAAIQAWNGDAATNIRYRYDGTTTARGGLQAFDNVNAILFEDPNGEATGSFNCSSPGSGFGVLAIGGSWTVTGSAEPRKIAGADIVVNDGSGCWFSTSKRAEQVYGHELGHTLGLGHSCGDSRTIPCIEDPVAAQALMRANAHADNRGARLNEDDQAGIFSLYPGSGGGGGSKPAAPSGLTATTASSTSIQLAWTDNAGNETSYRVEGKTTGSFAEIQSLTADATGTTVTGLAPGTAYTFRVRARNSAGNSGFSNEASATTAPAGPPSAPSNLTATLTSPAQIRLDWNDNSASETGFRIERSSPATGWALLTNVAANTESFFVTAAADTPYSFRLRANGAGGNSAFSNEASVTTPGGASGPCTAGAENLCLLGGRFRVSVQWRAAGGSGTGKSVPLSDQTGLFWFFGPENIELVVKMLDANVVNGFFWNFYGGLSDQEYWITVTDTETAETKTYHNAPGSLCGSADVSAFRVEPSTAGVAAPAIVAEAGLQPITDTVCAPGTHCLRGGRFQVAVSWRTNGGEGTGTPVPLSGTDESGLFWFFGEENIELVVKIIDGRPVNGKFWFFYGALSDVDYDITVTDTVTGQTKTYHNAQGNLCGRGDVEAFTP